MLIFLAVARYALVAMARSGAPIASLEEPHAAILPADAGAPASTRGKPKIPPRRSRMNPKAKGQMRRTPLNRRLI